MVVNLMLMKLKDRSPEGVEKAKNLLLGMNGKIKALHSIEIRTDTRHGNVSYDFAMFGRYNSEEDFQAYLVDPAHVEVGKQISEMIETIASVFYEE